MRTHWIGPLLVALVAAPAAAEDAPAKRSEGRYFVELSEIMLSANEFDLEMGTITGTGARAGEPTQRFVAQVSDLKEQPPRVTIGLNRPSGKTSVEFHIHDFHLKDGRRPKNFETEDQVATTPFLPPGVVFQRQQPELSSNEAAQDFVPNYGNELGYIRRVDYRSGGITVTHNLRETERYRLRWLGGLKYSELDQSTGLSMSFAKEAVSDNFQTQDFFFVQGKANTHGLGPNLGLDGRMFLDKSKKKWSLEARGEAAFIPESTSIKYQVSMVDTSGELLIERYEDPIGSGNFVFAVSTNTEAPIIPGIGSPNRPGDPFNALVQQQDFTDMTVLLEGRLGLRWQPSKYFTVGMDVWGMSWGNLLSDLGIFETIHTSATYEQTLPNSSASDPQLRDGESVIHVERMSRRDTFTFQGVSLNMKFDF